MDYAGLRTDLWMQVKVRGRGLVLRLRM